MACGASLPVRMADRQQTCCGDSDSNPTLANRENIRPLLDALQHRHHLTALAISIRQLIEYFSSVFSLCLAILHLCVVVKDHVQVCQKRRPFVPEALICTQCSSKNIIDRNPDVLGQRAALCRMALTQDFWSSLALLICLKKNAYYEQ